MISPGERREALSSICTLPRPSSSDLPAVCKCGPLEKHAACVSSHLCFGVMRPGGLMRLCSVPRAMQLKYPLWGMLCVGVGLFGCLHFVSEISRLDEERLRLGEYTYRLLPFVFRPAPVWSVQTPGRNWWSLYTAYPSSLCSSLPCPSLAADCTHRSVRSEARS